MRSRAIYGCAGTTLSVEERAFFRDAQPWGFILFARNIHDRAQVRALARPPRPAAAEMIEGSPDEIAGRIADIIKGRVR